MSCRTLDLRSESQPAASVLGNPGVSLYTGECRDVLLLCCNRVTHTDSELPLGRVLVVVVVLLLMLS